MSTRAIIGIKNPDGSILGAWQWNDGGYLTSILNKKFNTLEKAQALINVGMWSCIYTKRGKKEFEEWCKDNFGSTTEHKYTELLGMYLRKEDYYDNTPTVYSNYEEMHGQDINHTYLFNPSTNKWVKDKDIVL